MSDGCELVAERLRLRRWRDADREPFAIMNADPDVMEHFPSPLDRAASDALIDRIEAGFEADGFGLWAVEVSGGSDFIGFVGLSRATFEAPFTPAIEIGWRLARAHWGRGYATEAARRVLDHAFGPLGLEDVVSFTTPCNLRSRAVMTRLGLRRDPCGDFQHPAVELGDVHRAHVLYRIDRHGWAQRN